MARRIETDRERRNALGEKLRYQRYAVLGHGGGSTQNVGRWTNAMNKALVFDAPTEKPEMRKAFAIYYKGLQLRTSLVRELNAYVYWHHQQASANHGVVAENLRTTSERIALLGAIARRALVIGEEAKRHQFDVLVPDALAELTNSSVDSMERELIDSRLRIGAFGQRFARWIMRLVQTHQFELPGTVNKVVLGMSDTEAVRLAGVIEGDWQ